MPKKAFIHSTGSFSLSLLLTGFITIAMISTPFSGFYVMVGVLFMLPFFMQLVLRVAGPVAALASLTLFGFGVGLSLGPVPALFATAYLLVPVAVYALCLHYRLAAAKSMAAIALSYALCLLALYALSFKALGGAPFEELSRMMIEALQTMPERDSLLSTAYQFGLLGISQTMLDGAVIQAPQGGATFSPEVLDEFFKQIDARAVLWLRALVPSLISSLGPYLAIGGVYISDHYGKRSAQRRAFRNSQDVVEAPPELPGLPPFHKWFISKQMATPLWIIGGVYLLSRLSGQEALALAGAMLYNIFSVFFTIQGLSSLNFVQRQRGVRPLMRGLTLAAFSFILSQAAMILGLFDQFNDHRKLRKPDESSDTDTGRV